MMRGGDTPTQETLWAIEFESGKFAFGHANENQIFVATSGIGRQIWYADGGGVVEGYTESVDEITDTLIDTFNEHFGTNISHLTPDTELFKVGDTVHNWNAYEKIDMPGMKVKIENDTDAFGFGEIIGDKIILEMKDENKFLLAHSNGEIYGDNSGASAYLQYVAIPQINRAGYNVTNYELHISTYQIGDVISDWSNYMLIPR